MNKNISGILKVNYKNDNYKNDNYKNDNYKNDNYKNDNYKNDNFEERTNIKPDFAFVNDYYIPKDTLEHNNITNACQVKARAIFAGDKWKVVEIEKL